MNADLETERIWREADRQAVETAFWSPDADLPRLLLPIWTEAIHRTFLRYGCQCQKGIRSECIAARTPEEQRWLLEGHALSFEIFLEGFLEARSLFFERRRAGAVQH